MFISMRRWFLLPVLTGLVVFGACSSPKSSEAQRAQAKARASRKPAPQFTLTDSNGAKVKLADYRGKVVLLNFWATWCGPCQVEIPWFKEFEQQYKSKGLEVLGVSMDEDGWAAVKPYITEHKVNYRILLGDDTVAQLYGGLDALPTTFMIDREGKFAFTPHVGLIGKNEYVSEIQTLLDEKEETTSARAASPAAFLLSPAK
jgi:cytochrome c biogenesis protein CcmG/thiol:disulfide interchange protein DsbE